MKKTYTTPSVEIVNLSENDVLLFSKIGQIGELDRIIFGDAFK
jgi:hypothetical protein